MLKRLLGHYMAAQRFLLRLRCDSIRSGIQSATIRVLKNLRGVEEAPSAQIRLANLGELDAGLRVDRRTRHANRDFPKRSSQRLSKDSRWDLWTSVLV
jgi:hypothetical protein